MRYINIILLFRLILLFEFVRGDFSVITARQKVQQAGLQFVVRIFVGRIRFGASHDVHAWSRDTEAIWPGLVHDCHSQAVRIHPVSERLDVGVLFEGVLGLARHPKSVGARTHAPVCLSFADAHVVQHQGATLLIKEYKTSVGQ